MDYSTKKNKNDSYKEYLLELIILVDSDNKIKSIYEMKK